MAWWSKNWNVRKPQKRESGLQARTAWPESEHTFGRCIQPDAMPAAPGPPRAPLLPTPSSALHGIAAAAGWRPSRIVQTGPRRRAPKRERTPRRTRLATS